MKFATILLLSECIIFWFVVYCIRRKSNKINIEPAIVSEKVDKGSVQGSNKVTSPQFGTEKVESFDDGEAIRTEPQTIHTARTLLSHEDEAISRNGTPGFNRDAVFNRISNSP